MVWVHRVLGFMWLDLNLLTNLVWHPVEAHAG